MPLDRSEDSPRALLERLIAFPTVSRESNLDLIAFVEAWLAERGIDSYRVPSKCGQKASLYASVGPDAPGGVALSGHTDVVPVDGQDWTSDPFTLTERDGRLYGRGACDMKGFDALALWAMGEAAKGGLQRPLQLALSYDEEVGCAQAKPLAAAMLASGLPKADMVVVGEPSMMGVVTAHKGGLGYLVHAKGYEVHSSLMHEGVSAIMEAAKIIDWANQQNAANAAAEPSEIAAIFTPPWTTLHCGKIKGGTAHNITAGDCHFGFDFRFVPDEDEEDWVARFKDHVQSVQADMRRRHPDAGFTLMRGFSVPGLKPEPLGAAEELTRRITGDNETRVVSYGTEAGHFQNAGYSVVVCGPGDIAQAHQADEFISIAQMQAGEAFMRRLLDHLRKD